VATGCEEDKKLGRYSETSAINANVDPTANAIPIVPRSRMIAVTFFTMVTFLTTPIHVGGTRRYRAMRIALVIGLPIFKNLLQQRQFITQRLSKFHLLLMSQFSENALSGVCQDLLKARLKFRSQILPLVVKFF